MTEKKGKRRLDKDTLNLVIAVSAVLISAASFYAAYVQSEAAQKQVQAETWPYLQISHGNYDEERRLRNVYFRIINSGVGPAKVKTVNLRYKGEPVGGFGQLYRLCCMSEEEKVLDKARGISNAITGNPPPLILVPNEDLLFFSAIENEENKEAWSRLDKARFQITADACYCSLLDECFQTNFVNDPVSVKACTPERAGE
ncbi:hypothetical protein [Kordiimonas aquimaris]|uniref:hypothetical protein n=1 Tax=Kordiimonas aquimaris TaxID=707591 RepID=UPI0021CFE06D|nr:hypothetical protein [Kordiimonas aquimaris]